MCKGQPYNCLYVICTKVLTYKRFVCNCFFMLINPLLCLNVYCLFKHGLLKSARHFKAESILFGICNAGGVVSIFDLVILFGRLISDWRGIFCWGLIS